MLSLLEILKKTEGYLASHGSDSPRLESEWLIAHGLGLERIQLYLQFDRPISDAERAELRTLLRRRAEGEPIQYIVGQLPFHNCELEVGPGCLIPRPETEQLVEIALRLYDGSGAVLDLCTGSGAIVLAIANAHPNAPELLGMDISPEALAWAERNRAKLGFEHVRFLEGDLCAPLADEEFQLITANPPYVAESEYSDLSATITAHEPKLALVAADEGLAIIGKIAESAIRHVVIGGQLVCEIGETQGAAAQALFEKAGWSSAVVRQDYAERDRFVVAQR